MTLPALLIAAQASRKLLTEDSNKARNTGYVGSGQESDAAIRVVINQFAHATIHLFISEENHLPYTLHYHLITSSKQERETWKMAEPKKIPERTRHPDLWVVEAVRWEFREHDTEYDRLLAKKREKGPGVQLGQQIDRAEVPDRPYAVAIGRHLLDRYAEEAAGRMSLEIHIHPPEKDIEDESAYRVTDDVLEQARQLGLEGDVETQVRRMARDGTPYTHPRANLRHGPYALRLEANDVVWIGLVEPPPRSRKTK